MCVSDRQLLMAALLVSASALPGRKRSRSKASTRNQEDSEEDSEEEEELSPVQRRLQELEEENEELRQEQEELSQTIQASQQFIARCFETLQHFQQNFYIVVSRLTS